MIQCTYNGSGVPCRYRVPDARHEPQLPSDLTRIADALEKIARELEKVNKLNALSFRKDSYVELDEVDEIMEG